MGMHSWIYCDDVPRRWTRLICVRNEIEKMDINLIYDTHKLLRDLVKMNFVLRENSKKNQF